VRGLREIPAAGRRFKIAVEKGGERQRNRCNSGNDKENPQVRAPRIFGEKPAGEPRCRYYRGPVNLRVKRVRKSGAARRRVGVLNQWLRSLGGAIRQAA